MDTGRTIESPPCGINDCLLSGGCKILMFEYMNMKFCKLFLSEFDRREGKKSEMYIIHLKLRVQHLGVYIHRGYLVNFF